MELPELDRSCQCKQTFCPCLPCGRNMTQEDLLCNPCRIKKEAKHCHKGGGGEYAPEQMDLKEKAFKALTRGIPNHNDPYWFPAIDFYANDHR